jgi:hypothetical protein
VEYFALHQLKFLGGFTCFSVGVRVLKTCSAAAVAVPEMVKQKYY